MTSIKTSVLVSMILAAGLQSRAGDDLSGAASDLPVPPIGTVISELKFTDIRGIQRSLSDLGKPRAIVFAFTTSTCPLVRRSFPRLKELAAQFKEQNVLFVAVNAGAGDTIRDMATQAVDFEVPFYFVKDTDLSCVESLGIMRTPQVVILDENRAIRYRGRIDDQIRIGGSKPAASRHDLEIALTEILNKASVSVPETPVDGCEITRPVDRPVRKDVTWSEHVAPIIYAKCAECHRPETAAPFSLLTFEDVAANAEMIRTVVENETMPPWFAAKSQTHFQNDTSLSRDEKNALLDWIASGRPAGSLSEAPAVPSRSTEEWRIGKPDLIVSMLEQHEVPATGFVPYRYTILPYLFLKETWVEAIEIKPDNPGVVHHCNMAYVTKDGAGEETFITGYVPGGQAMDFARYNNGAAVRIPSGAGLGLQIHYTTTGKEERSRIRVGFRFPRQTVRKQVRFFLLDPRGWRIPPQDPAFRLEAEHTVDRDVNLLGMFAHMHVRGRDMSFYAVHESDPPKTLLQIPNYNFEWQLGYELSPGDKILTKGTKVRAIAHFDNSAFNPFNPDSAATVTYGPQSVDEMFNGFVFYVDNAEDLNLDMSLNR